MNVLLPQIGTDLKGWAAQLLVTLTQAFSTIEGEQPGIISLWPEDAPLPRGWLLCDGTEYVARAYPGLAKIIPESTPGNFEVPNLTPPAGVLYIIRT